MPSSQKGRMPPRRTEIKGEPHQLAYINAEEAALLRQLGGFGAPMAGSYGIPAYRDLGDDGRDIDRADPSGRGAERSGGPNRGDRGGGFGYAANAREAKARAGVYGAGEAGALGIHGARNADEENNIFNAVRDYRNYGNSLADDAGNLLASSWGLDERNPLYDGKFNPASQNQANWGWDPIQTATGIAGTVTGLPIGTAYGIGKYAAKQLFGLDGPSVNLGPDVFGGFGAPGADGRPSAPGGSGPGRSPAGPMAALGGAGNDPGRLAAGSQIAALTQASAPQSTPAASASRIDPGLFVDNSAPWGVQALRDLIAKGTPDSEIPALLDQLGHHNLSGRVSTYLSGLGSNGGSSGSPGQVGTDFPNAPHFRDQPLAQRQALANAINFRPTAPPPYPGLPGSAEEARRKWEEMRGMSVMPFGAPTV